MQNILQDLVAFQTVAGNTAANAAAIGYIESYLHARGMKSEIITHGGYQNLFASTTGSRTPKIMLAAHVDVVPAQTEMFRMRESDGKLHGRGVFDMKFSIAAYLAAVDALKDRLHDFDFGIMITPDEEVGSPNGVPRLIEAGYVPTGACVLPDGAENQNWDIETFAKGAWFGEFTATGKRAHGSRPWLGDNAIVKLLSFIQEVQVLFPPVAPEASTLTIGHIQGGDAINQVPERATVGLDMRFPSDEERLRLETAVEALRAKYDISRKDLMFVSPTINDFDNAYLRSFAAAVKTVTGVTSRPSNTPAGTDARFFTDKGLPVIICVPPGGGHHGDSEWIEAKGADQYTQVIIAFLTRSALRESRR